VEYNQNKKVVEWAIKKMKGGKEVVLESKITL